MNKYNAMIRNILLTKTNYTLKLLNIKFELGNTSKINTGNIKHNNKTI